MKELVKVFREARNMNHAVLVHVITKKGRDMPRQKKIRPGSTESSLLMQLQEPY